MQVRYKIHLFFITAYLLTIQLQAQNQDPPFLKFMDHPWVDSVLNTLNTDQRISQCIWIAAYSNRDISHEVETADVIRNYGIGGIIFFQGTPEKQAELTGYYQKISEVPLLISMDAEWGVGMRLRNVEKFPYQMTLGAIQDDSLIYRMGKAVARQCRRLGTNVNLAPVADININPDNPVINYRSFGEKRENVAAKAMMYMKGMQDNGVLAVLKHFPGHGDTDVDSHLDLPTISHSRSRLDSIELYPFRRLIEQGAGGIMTAHLNLPSLDTTSNLPSTLSPVIIGNLLKSELGFKGLIITDAMNMKGVTKFFRPGEAEAQALIAGNDVVEFVPDVPAAISAVKKALAEKKLNVSDIDLKCRKILALKFWAGLNKPKQIDRKNIDEEVSPPETKALIRELYSGAMTIIKNGGNILPVKNLQDLKIAAIDIGTKNTSVFQKRILDYFPADTFAIDPQDSGKASELAARLNDYDLIITGILNTDQRPNMNFGINQGLKSFLDRITGIKPIIIAYFGNPYAIDKLVEIQKANALIVAYQDNNYTQDLCAQLIFGAIPGKGLLPVSINQKWPSGSGIMTRGDLRIGYGLPENEGMSSVYLERMIDSIALSGIRAKAYPGCEVMVARKGTVVFHKAYGFHTYDNRIAVKNSDLYDLASVTKVSSTLAGLMLLDSEGKFSTDKNLGDYLSYFRRSDKGGLAMTDLLTHQAGLTAWIPFWKETVRKDSTLKRHVFRHEYSKKYPQKVADNLYINKNYRKRIFSEIRKSPLGEKKYVYSDLTFIIAPEIITKLSGEDWVDFVTENIYHKIGAYDLGFNPYRKYPLSRIVPTEYDSLFRRQLLHGTVHDEGAAMLGGISGHAGLFATENDLMKLMELYRRMGAYGGDQIIRRDILEKYTKVQFPENNNRRGLGFDKPFLNNSELDQNHAYPSKGATPESFGHSGYTGTFVWIDPEYDISYIFFSNRVYPTRNNNLLSDMNIRTNILQAVYDSVKDNRVRYSK